MKRLLWLLSFCGGVSFAQLTPVPITASSTTAGIVTAADWTTFNGKQANLGFAPVNKAGDTMTGTLQNLRFQSTSSSASLPSLDVSGNGGNGIYSGGTNIVAFSTNSTQAMTIGSNQVVAALATNESTTTGNGALVVTGGLGVGKTLTAATVNVTGNINATVAGGGIQIKEGSNARLARITLSGVSTLISNTSVTANTRVFLTGVGASNVAPWLIGVSSASGYSVGATGAGTAHSLLIEAQ